MTAHTPAATAATVPKVADRSPLVTSETKKQRTATAPTTEILMV